LITKRLFKDGSIPGADIHGRLAHATRPCNRNPSNAHPT
jgi:hypothetical protein